MRDSGVAAPTMMVPPKIDYSSSTGLLVLPTDGGGRLPPHGNQL